MEAHERLTSGEIRSRLGYLQGGSEVAHPLLKKEDKGDDVRRLQDLLNRGGALLSLDGDFGSVTEQAIKEAQQDAGLDVTLMADEPTWQWLEAQPEPSPELSCEGVTFVVREEVGSRSYYESHAAKPHFPGASSGVTIGIGYDLRFQNSLEQDWEAELTAAQLERLKQWMGVPGSANAVQGLADIVVPFRSAWRVFIATSLPKFLGMTRTAFPTLDSLPPLRRAVLVSLVYNRGTSMDPAEESRREVREIRDVLAANEPDKVPGLLESMKRLWPGSRGLRERRDREADLWRRSATSLGAGQSG